MVAVMMEVGMAVEMAVEMAQAAVTEVEVKEGSGPLY
jgi:hypothetical protein